MSLTESDTRAKLIDPAIHALPPTHGLEQAKLYADCKRLNVPFVCRNGTDSIGNPHIFRIPEIVQAGGLPALQQLGNFAEILLRTKERMFKA